MSLAVRRFPRGFSRTLRLDGGLLFFHKQVVRLPEGFHLFPEGFEPFLLFHFVAELTNSLVHHGLFLSHTIGCTNPHDVLVSQPHFIHPFVADHVPESRRLRIKQAGGNKDDLVPDLNILTVVAEKTTNQRNVSENWNFGFNLERVLVHQPSDRKRVAAPKQHRRLREPLTNGWDCRKAANRLDQLSTHLIVNLGPYTQSNHFTTDDRRRYFE